MATLEIEIKSLLGSSERADELRRKLKEVEPGVKLVSQNKQLNHYFVDGDVHALYKGLKKHLTKSDIRKLEEIVKAGSDFSIRTRLVDDKKLLFVMKASRDEGTSHNTVSRLEFEAEIPNMKLRELDELILGAGFQYQAKWSREREEYMCKDINVCLDKNAGYGYLAEFEKVVDDESHMKAVEQEIRSFMQTLGMDELPQDRLERMFSHYNDNWLDYYGTDKIFTVE